MSPKKDIVTLEAERLAIEMPEAASRTLARRLAKEFSITIEQARSKIRKARGASGARPLGDGRLEGQVVVREKRPAGVKPKVPPNQMPASLAEPWEPYTIGGAQRILVLSDIHVPYHSELALRAAVEHGKRNKPTVLLLNGDTCDFYRISRWDKDPRKRDFKAELSACRDLLRWLRSQFPKSQVIFKKGNHEERWDHWLWNRAPEIADCEEMLLENWLKFDELGIEMVEQKRPIMCGKLPVFHGHELPKGMTSPVNMARGAFLRMIDTTLVGHGHRSSSHTEASWTHKEITCWSTGCLCDLNPEYARINKWNWGFAEIDTEIDGSFNVSNLRINKSGSIRKS